MSDEPEFVGWKTLSDGTHVGLTAAEGAAIWEESERRRTDRAARMPDEKSALNAMFEAFDRLREIGWREGMYAPKDGTMFQIIEGGSTGIFECSYSGEWPNGYWITYADGETYCSSSAPLLYRLSPEDEAKRNAKMAAAAAEFQRARR
jgi:hypothetical protein